jgi:hypothetical protein
MTWRGPSPLLAWLLAALLCLCKADSAVPYYGRKINVCTSDTPPLVYCSGREPDKFSGVSVWGAPPTAALFSCLTAGASANKMKRINCPCSLLPFCPF